MSKAKAKKAPANKTETKEEAPPKLEKVAKGKFECTGNVKCDGVHYIKGQEYKGARSKGLLKAGAIIKV